MFARVPKYRISFESNVNLERKVRNFICTMMNKSKSCLLFFLIEYLLIPFHSTELTGLHYLFTVNCSSADLYIPQGPYLFSHHWPFMSISVLYNRQLNHGTCHPDGSLYFFLNSTRLCFGVYQDGQAEMTCQYETGEYCLMHLKTSDESQLTCT